MQGRRHAPHLRLILPPRPLVLPLDALVAIDTRTVQPSRPAASWSGCSWFSTVWPLSLVGDRFHRAVPSKIARTTRCH